MHTVRYASDSIRPSKGPSLPMRALASLGLTLWVGVVFALAIQAVASAPPAAPDARAARAEQLATILESTR